MGLLIIIAGGLAGLAALPRGGGSGSGVVGVAAQDVITDDTHFYGQSPPVYPSPDMTGTGSWSESYSKAVALVKQMTLVEKVNLTGGIQGANGCSGNIPNISRLEFPGLCLSDAGQGLRNTDFVSSWPSGITVGASWNRNLTLNRGLEMGGEFKRKGVNILLGPVVGPLGRIVRGGRNWEGISIDPYLSGALVHETVAGIQGAGVITSTKHYIANEQETNRLPTSGVNTGDPQIASVSSNIDDRTMHELYLWPFQDAVHAGSGNIMCSYERINNSYGCSNSKTLNGLLKTELGFQGFVVTDWAAQHAGVGTALAGLDMAMPGPAGYWGEHLIEAVKNGSVPESRVTDMAVRIIAAWYQMGQDKAIPEPGFGVAADLSKPHRIVDGRVDSSKPILMEGAVEGHVLVKNTNNALPLKSPKMISIFGYSAKAPDSNGYFIPGGFSAWGFGAESANFSELVDSFFGAQEGQIMSQVAFNGTLFAGGGSGGTAQSLVSTPFDAITQQAWEDGTMMFWNFHDGNPSVNGATDVCLVMINAWATEGFDRSGIRDDYSDGLIKNVANQCNNTVVVIHNAGVRIVEQFIDHPNVTALIFAHLPGQYSGKALVSILYGKSNPSGKLPYTVAKNESDYGAVLAPDRAQGIYKNFPQSNFSEGLFVDYRHFDAQNITPRYEFGFGLSYTTFNYSGLQVTKSSAAKFDQFPTGEVVEGGQKDLWDVVATVAVTVANTGNVDGAEVVQLYVTVPGAGTGVAPVRQLRGFDKTFITAGQSATVKLELTRRDLSQWDTAAQKWSLQSGSYTISVGSSSRKLPLTQTLAIP